MIKLDNINVSYKAVHASKGKITRAKWPFFVDEDLYGFEGSLIKLVALDMTPSYGIVFTHFEREILLSEAKSMRYPPAGPIYRNETIEFELKEKHEELSFLDTVLEGNKFYDTFKTRGWVVGRSRSPMQDWKSAVRTWIRNVKEWNNGSTQNSIGRKSKAGGSTTADDAKRAAERAKRFDEAERTGRI